jgi:hypothetical protein
VTNNGSIATMGITGTGIAGVSAGTSTGTIFLTNNGAIQTVGLSAPGITAVSLASTGNTGTMRVVQSETGTIQTSGTAATGIFAMSNAGADAGGVQVDVRGSIATTGDSAAGVRAQNTAIGTAAAVSVSLRGSIDARGNNADAIVAASTGSAGNGTILVTVEAGATASGGTGSAAAVRFTAGSDGNILTNRGTVTTRQGLAGATVAGGTANEAIENFGTYVGGASLGGGVNTFNNRAGGVLALGANLDLGSVANTLTNEGTLSPGGLNNVFTGAVGGKLVQTAAGSYALDLDFTGNTADRVNVTGSANLAGSVAVNPLNPGGVQQGTHSVTIASAAGGLTDSGLTVASSSPIVTYSLSHTATDENLSYTVDFTPAGLDLSRNQQAVADNIAAITTAGTPAAFQPVIAQIFNLPDNAALSDFYRDVLSEPVLQPVISAMFAGEALSDQMLSCRQQDGGSFRFTDEGECNWFAVAPRRITRESDTAGLNSKEDIATVSLGHQSIILDNFRLGLGLGYQNSALAVGNNFQSEGNRVLAGLALKYISEPVLFAITGNGGFSSTDTKRRVFAATATSEQNVKFASGRARLATQMAGEDFYIKPMVDLNGGVAWLSGYQEQGAGPLNLVVGNQHYTYASVNPQLEFGGDIPVYAEAVLRPFVRVGVTQALTGNKQDIAASFSGAPASVSPFVNRVTLDRTLGSVAVGADLLNAGRAAARLDYTYQFGKRTQAQGISLKLSTSW